MRPLLLGLDLGTSACKAGVFDAAGHLLALGSRSYPLFSPVPTWAEQQPADWWHAVTQAVRDCLDASAIDPNSIRSISIGGQTPGLVVVDDTGEPVRPAIIWQDRRAAQQVDSILSRFSPADLSRYLGTPATRDLLTTPARLMWLNKHEPETLRRGAMLLQPKDYINFRLTGEFSTDLSSAMGLVDMRNRRYHDRFFELLGLRPDLRPPLVEPTVPVGCVTPDAATESGLPAGTPVVAGTIDAMVSLLGCGAVKPGVAFEVTGTSEVTGVTVDAPVRVPGLVDFPVLGEALMLGGPTQAGGQAVEWFLKAFPPPDLKDPYGYLTAKAASVPPGAHGLVFLPYLAGERTPIWDRHARGSFIGITTQHAWRDFARAVLEGVAYAMAQILALAERAQEQPTRELRVCGGAARNAVWNQIKADITGKTVHPLRVPEAGVVGAAMLAGIGVGIFASFNEAANSMSHLASTTFVPDEGRHQQYTRLLTFYESLYSELKTSFAALADLHLAPDSKQRRGQE